MNDLSSSFSELWVNCGLKVGNSFLYIFFSLSISLTEIRNMFHFFCLCFFSLTDFFCAPLEPKNNNNIKEGFNFFRPQGNIFEPRHTRLYSVVESCTWARKKKNRSEPSLSRKALDFQDQHNDVNNSVKIQYNKLSWIILLLFLCFVSCL